MSQVLGNISALQRLSFHSHHHNCPPPTRGRYNCTCSVQLIIRPSCQIRPRASTPSKALNPGLLPLFIPLSSRIASLPRIPNFSFAVTRLLTLLRASPCIFIPRDLSIPCCSRVGVNHGAAMQSAKYFAVSEGVQCTGFCTSVDLALACS